MGIRSHGLSVAEQQMNPFIAVAIGLAYAAIDAAYVLYTAAIVKQQALQAASASVIIYLLVGSGIIAFSTNAWYLLPAAAGGFLGTYLTVKWQTRSAAAVRQKD